MPSFETLFTVLLGLLAAGGALALFAVLRRTRVSPAMTALGRGHFAEALAAARTGPGAGREELWAAAVAARHLLRFDEARPLLDRLLAADPGDGEARLESGLAAAYTGDLEAAERELLAAAAQRSDLTESITLHRAWVALKRGDRTAARRLFDEIEAPLESKLRSDLGSGEPLFAEWFLQAAALWSAFGDPERAEWAAAAGRASAPESRLSDLIGAVLTGAPGSSVQSGTIELS
jgi:tetratricopeptide (TPR) repeat protein